MYILDQENIRFAGGLHNSKEHFSPRKSSYELDPENEYERQRFKRYCGSKVRLVICSILLLLALTVGILVALLLGYFNTQPPDEHTFLPSLSILGNYSKAAVAADSSKCSEIGKDILLLGGSAVDAAIAAGLCNGLMNSHSMGIGGGFFMTVYDSRTGVAKFINARETAPAKSHQDMFHGNSTLSKEGWLSVAVPGEIKGYWIAHQLYGKLPWADLFEPAIRLCFKGYTIAPALGNAIEQNKEKILKEPSMRELFYNHKTGQLYKTGETMTDEKLGHTLITIAKENMNAFYTGEIAKNLTEEVQNGDGILTLDDLAFYNVSVTEAIKITLRNGLDVFGPSVPASGILFQFMLKVLDGYNFTSETLNSECSRATMYQRLTETMKYSYARRTALGDIEDEIKDLIQNMTSEEEAQRIRDLINDDRTFDPEHYGILLYNPQDKGTGHISVLDENGTAVSLTSTINTYFGSMRRSPSTGIILNNEMDDFSSPNITNYFGIPPSEANFIKPGKRPFSSMSPIIIINGTQPTLILGGSGGTRITSTVLQVAMNVIWFNMNIKQAIDERRLHHQLLPNKLQHEKDFPKKYLDRLRKIGHVLDTMPLSVVQGIHQHDGRVYANCDFRKGGAPFGY